MFDHLFENRNRTVTNLLKLSDCLGRSLRENVELFAIDSEKNEVAFLTEGGKVIVGDFDIEKDIQLSNIRVQEMEIFSDNAIFDSFVNEKVSEFIGNVNSDSYTDAEGSFSDILDLWENRLKFDNVKRKLEEKVAVFSESQNIVGTEAFQRFLEVLPQFSTFLSENKEEVLKFKEIENAIRLSNSVSTAFNFPRLDIDSLNEDSYKISKGINESIYELLCKKELVKKELLESKRSFDDIWATNKNIRSLASLMFEDSDEQVLEALVEAVVDVPFLALTTKKQLSECIDNALSLSDYSTGSTKDIKAYSSRLFEMKKPMKKMIISLLNEKYGINVQNLKESATFNSLATTQVVIFEALAKLAPKGSIVKSTLVEMSKMLKGKNGVEVIDVNDVLQECFSKCEYSEFINELPLVEGIKFDSILDEGETAKSLLEVAKSKTKAKKPKEDSDEDSDDKEVEDKEASSDDVKKKERSSVENPDEDEDDSVSAAESKDEEGDRISEEDEKPESKKDTLTQDDFLGALKDLDSLSNALSTDEGDDSEE